VAGSIRTRFFHGRSNPRRQGLDRAHPGALIGKRNACGPTLSSLDSEFGLAPLLGKSLAVISGGSLACLPQAFCCWR
jgi:hypothetical protein